MDRVVKIGRTKEEKREINRAEKRKKIFSMFLFSISYFFIFYFYKKGMDWKELFLPFIFTTFPMLSNLVALRGLYKMKLEEEPFLERHSLSDDI